MTPAVAAAAAVAGAAALIVWLRRRFAVIDVDGPSMQPTLYEGDRVLVRRRPVRRVRTGDIVVVESKVRPGTRRGPGVAASAGRSLSGRTWVIKRAAAVPGDPVPASVAASLPSGAESPVPDGHLLVLGDNATRSLDSRHYGYLRSDGVLGVVVRHLHGNADTG
ncbi:S26 family signal peptidase [Actinomadura sp. KC345]|uniref:S26 family signal peptidase n=1 Tax=Actinomadura sp. KC345 TaxID=2530371 RepID=UPI00104F98D7|nr:S26 family signal peptidase [Actinomadura sp. KC345]TDC57172.1 S26 family signal peptidase [Actinomadura sp. KC345]